MIGSIAAPRRKPKLDRRGFGAERQVGTAFYVAYLSIVIVAGAAFALATGSVGLLPVLAKGLAVTIKITAMSAALALFAAFSAGLARLYAPWPLRWLAVAYIELFRGTSALVQLFWLYFVLPLFGVELSAITVAVIGLGLNIGSYGAEVVRGAIAVVPKAQWDAAVALNLSRARTLRRIILPQAATAMIPSWGNLFIELLKGTSLVSLITLADLTFRAQQLNMATFRTQEIFILVLLLYLALSLTLTIAVRCVASQSAEGVGRPI